MDLSTSLMGLPLAHPFIAGASPLGRDLDTIKRLEDAGCAAIVLPSLFEEQITLAADGRIHHMDPLDPRSAARLINFQGAENYAFSPEKYAEHVARAKRAVHIPVIGSLNGTSPESWLRFAQLIEQAGADALELNMYEVVTDLNASGLAVEHQLGTVVSELKRLVKIPIAVKLSPFFTATGAVARRVDQAGADALALSTSAELPLRLRWLAILHGRVKASLIATGGVATAADGVKALLAGADAMQVVSAILRYGPEYFSTRRTGLEDWMDRHQMTRLIQMHGHLSLKPAPDPP